MTTDSHARAQADEVFKSYNVVKCDPECKLNFNTKDTNAWFLTGTYVDYKTKFSFMKTMTGDIDLNYRLESYLGKEPTIRECFVRVCRSFSSVVTGLGEGNCSNMPTTIYDNGC